jgi:hypothetical protein
VLNIRTSQLDLLWFQQDGATAHTAQIFMLVFRAIFPDRLISRFGDITRPARSPDLPIPDHILCGYVKSKVYVLPILITQTNVFGKCIQGIFKEMLQRVVIAFPSQCWSAMNDMVWSPTTCTKRNIQRVIIHTNSHGHGMYLLVFIQFFN